MTRPRKHLLGWIALAVAVLAAVSGRLLIDRTLDGRVGLAWPDPSWAGIRWTALTVGAIVGVALAVSGVLLQALLRNPLASPFVLGLSSGAGLGVMVSIYLAHRFGTATDISQGVFALLGAVGTLAIVYAAARRHGSLDPVTLVLTGVIVSAMCGALTLFLHHLVPSGLMQGEITRWLMGRIPEGTDATTLLVTGTLALIGVVVALSMGRAMDVASLDDDEARSVGISVGRLRLALFALAGALTAAAVALCGPIAFVGLIAPHAARLLIGPLHGPLVIGAALAGVALVVGADAARQAIDLGAGRMPIGVLTALLGGPTFLWLLRSGRGDA